jgi:hypothetical protein
LSRTKKPLTVFTIDPDSDGIPHVYFLKNRKGKSGWGGPNISVENNSGLALRITVDDITPEYRAQLKADLEKREREQLASLQKKYA